MKTLLVTGGAGFIGSCFVLQRIAAGDKVINLDKLTYSGNLMNLKDVESNPNYVFIHGDIGDEKLLRKVLPEYQPDAVVNFAAESHVDRSIVDPDSFVRTNVMGTSILLRCVKDWWNTLEAEKKSAFRFHHISTDEVFGTLSMTDPAFTEETKFAPNSPYSASKASSDHFVRAFHETYGLPTVITNCSNNYGPRQFPEKLIPLMTLNAIQGKPLPIYGSGENIRDWLHVEDHCEAIYDVTTSRLSRRSVRFWMSFVREKTVSLIRNRSRTLLTVWGMTFATQSTARRSSGNLAGRRSISLKMGSAKQLSGISITVNGLSPFRPVNTRTGLRLITAAETNCPEGADCGKQQE